MPTIHDPVFALPPRPPFRWGTSPFRARGLIYRDELAFDERMLGPVGLHVAELAKRSGDAGLEAFLAQRFEPMAWYDVQPILWASSMVARARGVAFGLHAREAAHAHAAAALGGFSAIVLKLVSNEAVATWLPRISSWYHDFGGIETRAVGPRHVRGVRTGIPAFFVQPWAISATSFCEQVLARAGAKDPRAHTLEADPDGTRDGHPLYRVAFEIKWTG